jgi:hypothetical protein
LGTDDDFVGGNMHAWVQVYILLRARIDAIAGPAEENPLIIGLIVFAVILIGAFVGYVIRQRPQIKIGAMARTKSSTPKRGEDRHEDLRCWRPVAERGVRPNGIVVTPPTFDDDLSFT